MIILQKVLCEKTLQKMPKFSGCGKSILKQIQPSCRKNFQRLVFVWFPEINKI